MKLKTINLILFILFGLTCLAQKNKNPLQNKVGFQITLSISNLKSEKLELYLISGSNKKQFVTDSITVNENEQTLKILQPKKIIDAIYYLRFKNQKNAIGLAIDNGAAIKLKLTSNSIDAVTCLESQINIDYLNFQNEEKTANPEQKIALRNTLKNKYPNSILSLYLSLENKIAEVIPTKIEEKTNYRNTFFNFFDKKDKRILFLPNLTKLLYKYVTLLPITSENYIENIDFAMKGMDCKTKGYKVFTNYFISNLAFFETRQLEKAYNHLYTTFIDKNPCDVFSASDYSSYSNKYATNLKVPLGSKIHDFEMISKDSTAYKLSEIYSKNDFTFLAFYSPNCIHCEEKIPVVSASFQNLKNKYTTKNIQLICVINDSDKSKWEQFIKDKNLTEWLNLKPADPNSKYQEDFNAYSNPCYFLLNKSGEVVLKTFNTKAIEELIKNNQP